MLSQWKLEFSSNSIQFSQTFNHLSGEKEGKLFFDIDLDGSSILFVTYSLIHELKKSFIEEDMSRTLIIVDEVHNLGSSKSRKDSMIKKELSDDDYSDLLNPISDESFYKKVRYRLGLSATPFSEYSTLRNQYIVDIFVYDEFIVENNENLLESLVKKNLIFYYPLEQAIQDNILVPFKYIPLEYIPTDEELKERSNMFKKFTKLAEDGKVSPEAPYIMASSILKRSIAKLEPFKNYLEQNSSILDRCIIFCHTIEFANKVARIISEYNTNYHIYVSGVNKEVLRLFSKGEFDILVTCKMIAEGIDIRNIKNIVLFSSDRQKLETIQRIGRALRKDPMNKEKIAIIIDFIYEQDKSKIERIPADILRKNWLSAISREEG